MEATTEKTQYLSDFTGKTPAEISEAAHEINMIRARSLGRLSGITLNTRAELKYLTWHGISEGFDPEESYVSVEEVKKIIAHMEADLNKVNEIYAVIGTGKLVDF